MKYRAASYYKRPADGLPVYDESGNIVLRIVGDSREEIEERAAIIMKLLNRDQYDQRSQRIAELKDNQENYDRGFITTEQYNKRIEEINNQQSA